MAAGAKGSISIESCVYDPAKQLSSQHLVVEVRTTRPEQEAAVGHVLEFQTGSITPAGYLTGEQIAWAADSSLCKPLLLRKKPKKGKAKATPTAEAGAHNTPLSRCLLRLESLCDKNVAAVQRWPGEASTVAGQYYVLNVPKDHPAENKLAVRVRVVPLGGNSTQRLIDLARTNWKTKCGRPLIQQPEDPEAGWVRAAVAGSPEQLALPAAAPATCEQRLATEALAATERIGDAAAPTPKLLAKLRAEVSELQSHRRQSSARQSALMQLLRSLVPSLASAKPADLSDLRRLDKEVTSQAKRSSSLLDELEGAKARLAAQAAEVDRLTSSLKRREEEGVRRTQALEEQLAAERARCVALEQLHERELQELRAVQEAERESEAAEREQRAEALRQAAEAAQGAAAAAEGAAAAEESKYTKLLEDYAGLAAGAKADKTRAQSQIRQLTQGLEEANAEKRTLTTKLQEAARTQAEAEALARQANGDLGAATARADRSEAAAAELRARNRELQEQLDEAGSVIRASAGLRTQLVGEGAGAPSGVAGGKAAAAAGSGGGNGAELHTDSELLAALGIERTDLEAAMVAERAFFERQARLSADRAEALRLHAEEEEAAAAAVTGEQGGQDAAGRGAAGDWEDVCEGEEP